MNTQPYQEGVNYLWRSVIEKSYSFGEDGTNINVVTKPIEDVQYLVVFQREGEAPYGGQVLKCTYVKALP